ncbi:hypothetical protein BsWGS_28685 [Bradybaena similaris]
MKTRAIFLVVCLLLVAATSAQEGLQAKVVDVGFLSKNYQMVVIHLIRNPAAPAFVFAINYTQPLDVTSGSFTDSNLPVPLTSVQVPENATP